MTVPDIQLSASKDLHKPGLTVSPNPQKTSAGSHFPRGKLHSITLSCSCIVSEWLPSFSGPSCEVAFNCGWTFLSFSVKKNRQSGTALH